MEAILYIAGLIFIVWTFHRFAGLYDKAKKYDERKPRLDKIEEEERTIRSQARELAEQTLRWQEKLERDKNAIEQLAKEKSLGFPWLATAYAEYKELETLKVSRHLATKKRPALKAAETVKGMTKEIRELERERRIYRSRIEYYETLFPWLQDLIGEGLDDLVRVDRRKDSSDDDAARYWLSSGEYDSLSDVEKYQLALDRYVKKKKSNWEIGKDYERYIGYCYENTGYTVSYQGILKGFDDLGRDIIAKKGDEVLIIQCKCWSKEKLIHEKHIFQLFGSCVEFVLSEGGEKQQELDLLSPKGFFGNAAGVFVTTTSLSDRARQFAKVLGLRVREYEPLSAYPMVKCNISKRTGEKIYHLPFDQQYDKVIIEPEFGEFYASTVAEAEEKGFRRAWRWRPSDE